jgi:hypothetical protein
MPVTDSELSQLFCLVGTQTTHRPYDGGSTDLLTHFWMKSTCHKKKTKEPMGFLLFLYKLSVTGVLSVHSEPNDTCQQFKI